MTKTLALILTIYLFSSSIIANELKIITSPAISISIDKPVLLGGSLKAGVKKGRHYLGGEYSFYPKASVTQDDAEYSNEINENTVERELYGGGLFYIYDFFVSDSKNWNLAVGIGAGYWEAVQTNSHSQHTSTKSTSYGEDPEFSKLTHSTSVNTASMYFAPKFQMERNISSLISIFASATLPIWPDFEEELVGDYNDYAAGTEYETFYDLPYYEATSGGVAMLLDLGVSFKF